MSGSIRLGFYYHAPIEIRDDGVYTLGYLGRFVDALAAHSERLVCFHHEARVDERPRLDYRISNPKVTVVDLGPRGTVPERMLKPNAFVAGIVEHLGNLDALLVRGPSPLLPAVARRSTIPIALLLVGDYVTGTNDLEQPVWRRAAIHLWARWNRKQQTRAARRTLTFVNSEPLRRRLEGEAGRLVLTQTATVDEKDFYVRDDTCCQSPYRLLYAGRIVRSKGIFDLVKAVKILTDRRTDVTLDLVGWTDHGEDETISQLNDLIERYGLVDRVQFHGFKPMGPALFAHYRNADLFVMPSHNEGFPRVLWEALAHSLPVVATRVGGVPHVLEDGAEARLVPAGDPPAIAAAIEELIRDGALRRSLIRRGRTLASNNTLRTQAEQIVGHIESWLQIRMATVNSTAVDR